MSGISTHLLDVSLGKPAAGVEVQLERSVAGQATFVSENGQLWKRVAEAVTDSDGRCRPLLAQEQVDPGIYRLTFVTGPYFHARAQSTLYPEISITFSVQPGERNYHIPLLLSPHGYTTYRGS